MLLLITEFVLAVLRLKIAESLSTLSLLSEETRDCLIHNKGDKDRMKTLFLLFHLLAASLLNGTKEVFLLFSFLCLIIASIGLLQTEFLMLMG